MPDHLHARADDLQQDATAETPVVHEVVRRVGERDMARPARSLVRSGLAPGTSTAGLFGLPAHAQVMHEGDDGRPHRA